MKDFLNHINELSLLKDEEAFELINVLETKFYKKGDSVLKINQINRNLLFINDGLLKLSFYKEDKEFVMRFFCENEFCAALDSFVTQQRSNYSITALEDTHLIAVDYIKLNQLAEKYHAIEKLFRRITSRASINMMNRIREMLETNGAMAYSNFLKHNTHLINRISLGDLSGYLGISQVSLSRIRAKR